MLSDGSIIVGITQKRRKKLRDLADTALAAQVVPGAILQSIIGKARFVLSAAFSSLGKACLQPLQQHAAQRDPGPLSECSPLRDVSPLHLSLNHVRCVAVPEGPCDGGVRQPATLVVSYRR